MLGFVRFNDEPEQYLCAAVLRPGNVTAAFGAVGILRRLVPMVRYVSSRGADSRSPRWRASRIPMCWLYGTQPRIWNMFVAMAKNAVLKRKAKPAMRRARKLSRQSGETEHVYHEARYAAQMWPHQRRVILKAEVVRTEGKAPKDNPRFVITNMKQSPQRLYQQVYCQRGGVENRIKELHRFPDRPHQLNVLKGYRSSSAPTWSRALLVPVFPVKDKNCSPSHRNGFRLQTGMLFGITTEWCSASHRNRVRLRRSPE